jgi:tRNA (guanine37-N1)-methyltransferase
VAAGQSVRFDCITLFPEMFSALTDFGVIGRAGTQGLWSIGLWNPRDYADGNYRTVDDRPYGGGPGMLMMAEPLARAVGAAQDSQPGRAHVLCLSAQGRPLTDERVRCLAGMPRIILLCGRYEGIDDRLLDTGVDEEISLGDYVISGGELAAMVLIDAVVRQLPGTTGDARSPAEESFHGGLLDWPHYTRPEVWRGAAVPRVLLNGNHAEIARWRLKQSLGRTWLRRPDLLAARGMNEQEAALLAEFRAEGEMKESKK